MNIPTQETEEQKSKCITKGCRNYKHQGEFIGDLCAPCFLHITSGNVIPTESFVGDLQRQLTAVTEQRDRLAEALRKAILWGDSASHHILHRQNINWTYLNEAKEALQSLNQ